MQDLIACYRMLADRTDHALHLGLTEAGMGSKGLVAASAAMGVLLQDGIGDTIRYSLTPEPGGDRTLEVKASQELLQTMGFRSFTPQVAACPGCGRTTSTVFQELAQDIQGWLSTSMPDWKTRYPGVEALNVAVMGCIVNGPGESKHADIGISFPAPARRPRRRSSLTARRPRRSRAPASPPNSSRWSRTISSSGSAAVTFAPDGVELGLGLLSIGRVWGVAKTAVPTDSGAGALLETALARGIRIFDTAPAYAASERRLGAFLRTLRAPVRDRLVVMTKMGEHWDETAAPPMSTTAGTR